MDSIDRAVVIGGSIGGLASAVTLSSRARQVVVVERRPSPDGGCTAPQGRQPHVLLVAGARVLEQLIPGFAQRLLDAGAADGGPDPERIPCYWAAAGTVRDHLRLPDLGFPRALCSRAMLESHLREAASSLPNVTVVDGSVEGLELSGAGRRRAVTGVRLRGHPAPLPSDLVVDASGRNTRARQWLAAAGLPQPPVTEVVVDLRYTSLQVERRPGDLGGAAFAVIQNTAENPRIGVALPMEGDRWQIALGAYFGDSAPADVAGAEAFARSLADPLLCELVSRPRLTDPAHYSLRSNLRRHWEKLPWHPRGVCAIGDAVASFNPIYGQGMTSALQQAEAMGAAMDQHGNSSRLAHAIARGTAHIVDHAWTTATGGDFMYAQTVGRRPPGVSTVNRYVERVMRASAHDEVVNAALSGVQQLLAPPAALFLPSVLVHTMRHGTPPRTRSVAAAAASGG